MGIGSITSTNSSLAPQMPAANLKDSKSKTIQRDISNAQQQMQKLSSKEDLSAGEKANEQKKLQKEISSLNTELKQHQQELSRTQKREIMMAELLENEKPAKKEEDTSLNTAEREALPDSDQYTARKENIPGSDQSTTNKETLPDRDSQGARPGTVIFQGNDGTVILKEIMNQETASNIDAENKQTDKIEEKSGNAGNVKESTATDNDKAAGESLSPKEMYAMGTADSSVQQADRLGTIVTQIRDDIDVLKGEINQDEKFGGNTERKQAELEKMEEREQRAENFQFSILGEANNAMKSALEINGSANGSVQSESQNTFHVSGLSASQEEQQAAQQRFQVAFA